jgi:CHASE3 domain sensor protein
MKDRAIRLILGFFVAIGAIVAAVAYVSVRNIGRSIESSDWVNHTHAVMLDLKDILGDVHACDGYALSYAMGKDPRNRTACRAALGDLAEHLARAKALTRREPAQAEQVARLDTLANARAEVDRAILNAQTPEAVPALLGPDGGIAAMDDIRKAVDRLINEETVLLEARDRQSFIQAGTTRWTVWTGAAVDLVLLVGVGWLISDDIKARRVAATALREANEQLEAKVQERTAELADANRRLMAENVERKWANQALEHQLRYNQLIINSIPDLVFVLTKAVNVSRINPAVIAATGLDQLELVNKPFSRFVRLENGGPDASLVDPVARSLADGRDLRGEAAVVMNRQGGAARARLDIFPLRDQNKVVGGVAILQLTP